MVIFHSYVNVYQRVSSIQDGQRNISHDIQRNHRGDSGPILSGWSLRPDGRAGFFSPFSIAKWAIASWLCEKYPVGESHEIPFFVTIFTQTSINSYLNRHFYIPGIRPTGQDPGVPMHFYPKITGIYGCSSSQHIDKSGFEPSNLF